MLNYERVVTGNKVHLLPDVEDNEEHILTSLCSCGVRPVLREGQLILVHRSFNGNDPYLSPKRLKEILEGCGMVRA